MKRYKVKALYVQGLRKQPYEAGDVVREDNFYEGIADYLVREKFIEEISDDGEKPILRTDPDIEITRRPVEVVEEEEKFNEGKDLNFKRTSRNEMKMDLQLAGIRFDEDESKTSLYEKWKNLRQ